MDWKNKLENLSVGELVSIASGFTYVTGYLIASLYVRSRGINKMSLLSAQYIETGLVFFLLTGLFIIVPVVIFRMAHDSRLKHGYPNRFLSLVFPIVTTNYLYVFVFFALLVTRYEWLLRFRVFGQEAGLIFCFIVYTVTLFFLQVLFLFLKYSGNKSGGQPPLNLENAEERPIFVSPIRKKLANISITAALLVTLWFDFILFNYVGWFREFMSRASAYLFCILIILAVGYLTSHLSRIYANENRRLRFWFVAGPLFLALYYFAISSYEFGIYINIPMSRGGKYPVTETTLFFKPDSTHAKEGKTSMKIYVIEETDDCYYVIPTTVKNWFQDHPPVKGISKSEVAYPFYEHLRTGEPRINHLK